MAKESRGVLTLGGDTTKSVSGVRLKDSTDGGFVY
jgi:hypothetical protein